MAIIVSKNGKNAEKLDQSNFDLEDKLQEYIYDNPDTIPLYDIDEDTRLFIAAREFSTKSGPIDALGFDARGNIYVVETKLYKNPDKRTVVAQALDYGASLWRQTTNISDFFHQLDLHTQKQFSASFQEKYTDFFSLEDASASITAIEANLSAGIIKFVVLMDRLHDPLKDLVVYVNQNSKFDLYAVELEYYKHQEFEIIIPKLFGAEVKKDITTTANKSQWQWSVEAEGDFVTRLNDMARSNASIDPDIVLKIIDIAKKAASDIGGSYQFGHVVSKTRDVGKFILNNSDNKAVFYIDSDTSSGFYMWDASSNFDTMNKWIRDQLIARNIFGKASASNEATQTLFNLRTASREHVEAFMGLFQEAISKFSV